MASNRDVVIFDLESNCSELGRATDIIQIGAVKLDTHTGEIVDTFNMYVKPPEPVTQYCVDLLGITNEMLSKAKVLRHVVKKFTRKFGESAQYAAWGCDDRHLSVQCARGDASGPIYQPVRNFINLQSLYGYIIQSPNSVGLKTAMEHFNLTFQGKHHDALYDSINTANVYMEILKAARLGLMSNN